MSGAHKAMPSPEYEVAINKCNSFSKGELVLFMSGELKITNKVMSFIEFVDRERGGYAVHPHQQGEPGHHGQGASKLVAVQQ